MNARRGGSQDDAGKMHDGASRQHSCEYLYGSVGLFSSCDSTLPLPGMAEATNHKNIGEGKKKNYGAANTCMIPFTGIRRDYLYDSNYLYSS